MRAERRLWQSIQALPDAERDWLFAQLGNWPPFRAFLESRHVAARNAGHTIVIFDGGSKGNPGPGYGSYSFQLNGGLPSMARVEFGEMTNNEAEYEALIAALEDLHARLVADGISPLQHQVTVRGDSRLVINQVTGAWKARDPRMLLRRNRAREILARFGRVSVEKVAREQIVEVLGH
jgi:ribonuclease HI